MATADPAAHNALNVLFLYDSHSVHINTVHDHLDCFREYSRHNVVYSHATNGAPLTIDLNAFDAVVVHYSCRLAFDWHISQHVAEGLRSFDGLKALFIQDEYDNTWQACDWINCLGIGVVFTCVPDSHVRQIYSRVNHERVAFYPVLTGYLPMHVDLTQPRRPIRDRKIAIGYRGRELPFRYGRLAREKFIIGQRMRDICVERKVRHDIEWSEDKRLYGPGWLEFMANCQATLGAESGSNVFDFDGSLTHRVDDFLRENPTSTFDEVFDRVLAPYESEAIMNQVSPRVFESIAMGTALVLFEGRYSGVIEPHEHYIPLKKDFSNVDEVLEQVRDVSALQAMTDRAFERVVGSGRYTYRSFVARVDDILSSRCRSARSRVLVARVAWHEAREGGDVRGQRDTSVFTRPVRWSQLERAEIKAGMDCPALTGPADEHPFASRGPRLRRAWHAFRHTAGWGRRAASRWVKRLVSASRRPPNWIRAGWGFLRRVASGHRLEKALLAWLQVAKSTQLRHLGLRLALRSCPTAGVSYQMFLTDVFRLWLIRAVCWRGTPTHPAVSIHVWRRSCDSLWIGMRRVGSLESSRQVDEESLHSQSDGGESSQAREMGRVVWDFSDTGDALWFNWARRWIRVDLGAGGQHCFPALQALVEDGSREACWSKILAEVGISPARNGDRDVVVRSPECDKMTQVLELAAPLTAE